MRYCYGLKVKNNKVVLHPFLNLPADNEDERVKKEIGAKYILVYSTYFSLFQLDITNGHTRRVNLSETAPNFTSPRSRSLTPKSMGKIQVKRFLPQRL